MFADYNFVNPMAPACSQILIIVLEALGIIIDKEIGTLEVGKKADIIFIKTDKIH